MDQPREAHLYEILLSDHSASVCMALKNLTFICWFYGLHSCKHDHKPRSTGVIWPKPSQGLSTGILGSHSIPSLSLEHARLPYYKEITSMSRSFPLDDDDHILLITHWPALHSKLLSSAHSSTEHSQWFFMASQVKARFSLGSTKITNW